MTPSDADLIAAGAQRVERVGDAVLILGDCRDIAPRLPRPDAIVSDPPYGVEFRGEAWDREIPQLAFALPEMADRVAIIMGTTAAWQFPAPKWVACWARPASSSRSKVGGFSHWSPILLYGDVKMAVDFRSWHAIAHAYPAGFEHPSPKPECVMDWLIGEVCEPDSVCLDPYMGSGTTGVACLRRGVRFIGIEIEPRYFDVACRRIAEAARQPSLFDAAPAPKPQQLDMSYPVERMA